MGMGTLDRFGNYDAEYSEEFQPTVIGEWARAPHSLRITQRQVDRFVESTIDVNSIHRLETDHPIVPGMLLASLFRGFFDPDRDPIMKEGYVTVLSQILQTRFLRPVKVGTLTSLRHFFHPATPDRRMFRVVCDFEIYAHPEVGQPVKVIVASFEMILMPTRMSELLLANAV